MTIETEAGASYCQCSMRWGNRVPVFPVAADYSSKFLSFSGLVQVELGSAAGFLRLKRAVQPTLRTRLGRTAALETLERTLRLF